MGYFFEDMDEDLDAHFSYYEVIDADGIDPDDDYRAFNSAWIRYQKQMHGLPADYKVKIDALYLPFDADRMHEKLEQLADNPRVDEDWFHAMHFIYGTPGCGLADDESSVEADGAEAPGNGQSTTRIDLTKDEVRLFKKASKCHDRHGWTPKDCQHDPIKAVLNGKAAYLIGDPSEIAHIVRSLCVNCSDSDDRDDELINKMLGLVKDQRGQWGHPPFPNASYGNLTMCLRQFAMDAIQQEMRHDEDWYDDDALLEIMDRAYYIADLARKRVSSGQHHPNFHEAKMRAAHEEIRARRNNSR